MKGFQISEQEKDEERRTITIYLKKINYININFVLNVIYISSYYLESTKICLRKNVYFSFILSLMSKLRKLKGLQWNKSQVLFRFKNFSRRMAINL
jgi:hypothetical protein